MMKYGSIIGRSVSTQTYWLRRKKTVFLLIVTLVILAACQTALSPPEEDLTGITEENLIGIWKRQTGEPFHFQFNEDGTFRVADSEAVLETSSLIDMGEFQLEGTVLTLTTSNESDMECAALRGIYQIAITEEGHLQFTLDEDECYLRGSDGLLSPWERVSP